MHANGVLWEFEPESRLHVLRNMAGGYTFTSASEVFIFNYQKIVVEGQEEEMTQVRWHSHRDKSWNKIASMCAFIRGDRQGSLPISLSQFWEAREYLKAVQAPGYMSSLIITE